MTPAVEVRVWRDNGSAAGEKSIWSPLVTDADLGRSLHLPGGFAVRQGDTPYLISPNARLLNDQDEKGSLHPTGSPITSLIPNLRGRRGNDRVRAPLAAAVLSRHHSRF